MNHLSFAKATLMSTAIAALLITAGCNKEKTAAPAAAAEIKLDTLEQKVTYIVGFNMATQAKANGLEFNKDIMSTAITDVLNGKEARIKQEDQQKIMMEFHEQQTAKQEKEQKEKAVTNLKAAETFLAENGKKEGVKTTASGLQYQVITAGPNGGATPKETDTVKVHYHGTLIDNTVFDSSVERGEPVTFPVNGVIKGWVEGLQLMKVGDKVKLFVPPALAYGEAGTSGKIGPNAALVFDVELLEINPKAEEPKAEEPKAEVKK